MSTLYIVQAQPNPPGKDTVRPGLATNDQLNNEWLEFEARGGDRDLVGDNILHLTFSASCSVTGQQELVNFNSGSLNQGQRIRLHSGAGMGYWDGNLFHMYLGRTWFVWNNACGDRASIKFQGAVVDTAGYRPNPPEGILVRVDGTDRLEPAPRTSTIWR